MVEEKNRPLKAWIHGEPDADLWRSAVRNLNKLEGVRAIVFDRCALQDPLNQPRVHPAYTSELLEWRATLRPFLAPNGNVGDVRQLESLTGEPLHQDAVRLTSIAEERRCRLYVDFMAGGSIPAHRPRQQSLPISLDEAASGSAGSRSEIGDDDDDVSCGVSEDAAAQLIADLFED